MLRFPSTHDLLLAITIGLGSLLTSAVEFYSVRTGDIIDHFLFHVAVGSLDVTALIIILGGGINFVGCITNTVFSCETSLNLIGLLQSFIVNGLYQVTDQFIDVEANSFDVGLYNACAILEKLAT